MSTTKQKSLEGFIWLAPPRFDGTHRDRAHDFLLKVLGWLCNLAILESHGFSYTSYQFTCLDKECWRIVLARRCNRSPTLTWDRFTKVFLERFLLYGL